MLVSHRPYQGFRDFIAMKTILAIGRKIDTASYYVHTGDLSWWMFYSDHHEAYWQEHVCLWHHEEQTIGWTLLDTNWHSFDIYLMPEQHGTLIEEEILDWSIACLTEMVRQQGGTEIQTVWVAEHDTIRIDQLKQRDFKRSEYAMWYLERALDEQLPVPHLPLGYHLRQFDSQEDVRPRASAAHRAFASKKTFDEYWPRYQRFVDSPVYISTLDLVTVAPDGDFSSFCIVWPDPVNHVGLFEPVGTHPDFQSQGLGRAVVAEGLRQLQHCGMRRAAVCVEADNFAAQRLYEAVGFQKQYQLLTYAKAII